jgi:hypothetical protein
MMCCNGYNTNIAKLIGKAIVDAAFREQFIADPIETAKEFGLSKRDRIVLAEYEIRKLRAMVRTAASTPI